MGEAIQKDQTTPARFYNQVDKHFNDTVVVEDLKNHAKNTLGASFNGNFVSLELALDQQRKGFLTKEEFVGLIDNAMDGEFQGT